MTTTTHSYELPNGNLLEFYPLLNRVEIHLLKGRHKKLNMPIYDAKVYHTYSDIRNNEELRNLIDKLSKEHNGVI